MAESIRGINVVIGADTTGLSKALSDVNKRSRDIQSELKQVEKLLKLDPSNTELIAQKQQLLAQAIENSREKLDRLRAVQEQVNEQFQRGEISEGQYRAFQRETEKTRLELEKLEQQLRDMEPAVESFGEKMQKAGDKLKSAGEKMTDAGKKLSVGVTAPLAAAAGGLVAAGAQFDDAFDKIRVGTGATGEALEALQEDFRQVAVQVPASFDDISTAIADYNTRLGLSGEALQELSTQTLELTRLTGGDLAKTIEETSQVFQAFNLPAEEYGKALDHIFLVSQSTGIGIERLESNMTKFAPALKQLGLDFDDAAVLMGQLDKAGVDVEQTLAGLNKAVVTMAKEGITDANEAIQILFDQIKNAPSDLEGTQIALDTFGSRAGPALASAIREGKLEYQDLLREIKGSNETILGVADETKDWSEQLIELKNNLLLAIEPLAERFFGAINDLIPLVKDFADWIARLIEWFVGLPDGVQKTVLVLAGLAAAIGPLLVALGPLVSGIGDLIITFGKVSKAIGGFQGLMTLMSGPVGIAIAAIALLATAAYLIIENWEPIKEFFVGLWDGIKSVFLTAWEWLQGFMGGWGPTILAIIAPVIGIPLLIAQHWDEIKTFVIELWNSIVNFLKNTWKGIKDGITTAFSAILDAIKPILDGYKTFFSGIWDAIKNIFAGALLLIVDLVKGDFTALKKDAEAIWNNLKDAFRRIWDGIKQIFSGALDLLKSSWSAAWNTIKSTADSIWQAIKDGIQQAIDWIKGLPSQLTQLGKDMIQGLVNGIKNMIGSVGDAVKNIADRITGGLRDFLKISSPSRVMMKLGEDTGEGFVLGLENRIREVSNQAKQLAKAALVSPATNQNAVPVQSSDLGGGSVTITNYFTIRDVSVREDADIDRIVEKISRLQQQGFHKRGVLV